MMKKIGLLIFIVILSAVISCLTLGATIGFANDEIVLDEITKIDADGQEVAYENTYSRDVTLKYTFSTASFFAIKVYIKGTAEYEHLRTTDNFVVSEGRGTYKVLDEGDLRVDCIAKDANGFEIANISTYVKSDITAPLTPIVDVDGAMDLSHAGEFSVAYQINYDELSGVDFTRSTYRFEDENGNVIIDETNVYAGYDKALVGGIDRNGTLYLTIYDKAGNFIVGKKSYHAHYYVDSIAPTISVTPSTGYSKNVMVTLEWPQGVSYKYYRLVVNGKEQTKIAYTVPFSVESEGTVIVRAYYYENGSENYVTKTIDNVDKTPPTASSIEESIMVKVDLMSSTPVTLSLKARDARSGIKRVYLKNFGSEFTLVDTNTYLLDVTNRLGTNVTIVAEDNAGNSTDYNYPLNGYDKTKIDHYSSIFLGLDKNEYDEEGWESLLHQYNRLSNLISASSMDSGKIQSYSQELDRAIEGKYQVKVTLNNIISGLNNDFKVDIITGETSVKKGGKINVAIDKIDYSDAEINEKITVGATIAKYPNYDGYGFNVRLSNRNGEPITIYNQFSISLTIPGSNNLAQVYYEDEGVLTQLSSSIENGVITFNSMGYGNFYFIVEKEVETEQEKGLTIAGKFYPLDLLLIAGGIILGAIVLVGILTPIIYKAVKIKKINSKKFNYLR